MWFPLTQTHPAKLRSTCLILAYHVIASTVLLDCHMTLGTFFRVRRDPIRCFRIVIALFYPFLKPFAFDRIVPQLTTTKTKRVSAQTTHQLSIEMLRFDGVRAIGRRTPSHQAIAFDKTIRY